MTETLKKVYIEEHNYTKEQQLIIDTYKKNLLDYINEKEYSDLLLTGSAGTGKTYTACKCIEIASIIMLENLDIFQQMGFEGITYKQTEETKETIIFTIYVLSPTHKAKNIINDAYRKSKHITPYWLLENNNDCVQVNFCTIQRFLGMKQNYDENGNSIFKLPDINSESYKKKSKTCPIIFIEESSMINKKQSNYLLNMFPKSCITFLGDPDQLPPVKEDQSLIFKNFEGIKLKLENIMRTENAKIKELYKLTRLFSRDTDKQEYVLNNIHNYCNIESISKKIKTLEKFDTKNDKILTYSNKDKNNFNNIIRSIHIPDYKLYKYCLNEKIVLENFLKVEYNQKYAYLYPSDEFIIENVNMTQIKTPYTYNNSYKCYELLIEDDKRTLTIYAIHEDHLDTYISDMKMASSYIHKCLACVAYSSTKTGSLCNNDCIYGNQYKKCNCRKLCNSCNKQTQKCIEKILSSKKIQCTENQFCNNCKSLSHNCKHCYTLNIKRKYCESCKDNFNRIWDEFYTTKNKYNSPITYGYSSTVYKSQGSTYDNIFINYSNIWYCPIEIKNKARCLYTSVTRGKHEITIFV
jgi:hypothetical protein